MTRPSEVSAWARLTSIATLGTQRAPLPADLWPDPTLGGSDAASEQSLLRAAAATYLWQVAGRRSSVGSSEPDGAPFRPTSGARDAGEAAAWRLARMLAGEHRELVPEWLEVARREQRRVPTHWLPVALDALRPAERQRFADVLGEAAEWLAAQNPSWAPRAAVEPSEQRWLDGSLEERLAQLALLRARSPERTREWIERTWSEDPPEAREAFVGALAVGLSDADEPLLERALDDKRKAVRLAASECLSRLPRSAHALRNLARVEPLFVLDPERSGLLARFRKRALTVTLPVAPDKAAQRDGIEAKRPAQIKLGERAFWLVQMLERVPPSHWSTRFACTPAVLVEAMLATEYATDLLAALSAASARHPDPAWIEALCDAQHTRGSEPLVLARALAELLRAAPAEHRLRLLEAQVQALRARGFPAVLELLTQIEAAWTPSLTSLALGALAAAASDDRHAWPHPRHTLETWGRRCHVGTARPLTAPLAGAPRAESPWGPALERLHEIVEFRASMQEELCA